MKHLTQDTEQDC